MPAGVVGTKVQQLIMAAVLLVAAVAMGLFLAQSSASQAGVHASAENESETVAVASDGWEW